MVHGSKGSGGCSGSGCGCDGRGGGLGGCVGWNKVVAMTG